LLDAYRGYIDGMRPRLPQLFGRLPKAGLTVEPVPAFLEKDSAPAYYEEGTADGKRPGTFFVDTYKFETRSLPSAEDIAYHEGIPGHHLQISIAQELTGLPEFRKHLGYTAYTEGWGLYAERLGKDVGLYQDPYNDFARLEGRGSRWWISSTHIPGSTRPRCSRRSTATSRGRGRRWVTRSGS
jgi:uncharacterized protein (DUF885 family)